MKNTNLISFREYVIDMDLLTYKAIWNCQVEWTDECIYYDAETGRVSFEEGEVEFICEHQHKVTKGEYLTHMAEAKALDQVEEEELKQLYNYRQVV